MEIHEFINSEIDTSRLQPKYKIHGNVLNAGINQKRKSINSEDDIRS